MASICWQRYVPGLRRGRKEAKRSRWRKGFRPVFESLEARTLLSVMCATPGKDGTPAGPLSGVVNTYYAGTASVAAGATSLQVGAARGSSATITPGDLLLVIQVQNAAINSSNSSFYGDGTGSGSGALSTTAGTYEYVEATDSVGAGGGTLTFAGTGAGGGLQYGYQNAAATALHGQETYEVVRVPQYLNATLGSTLTAAAWNGSTGGILALDVAGNLNLNSATVSVDGEGFRGGGGRALGGGSGSSLDYVQSSTINDDGSKGEGTAGTPEWVYDLTSGTTISTGQPFDGLPGGSAARGAPGNAGGGGTDADPSINDQNTGGGGGANGGAGGQGGYSWATALNLGGEGGAAYAATPSQLVLGGGGGAGARNNSSGAASSGGAGGGVILVRAGSVSGTGTLTANGIQGIVPQNDGGSGGGAGGSVEVLVDSGSLNGLTVQAKGARGIDAWPTAGAGTAPPPSSSSNFHGPGGGGGGGVIVLSSAAGGVDVSGGAHATTTTADDIYGSANGQPGIVIIGATSTQVPGIMGGASCTADVAVTVTAPATVPPGGTLTYTLTVTNNGPMDAASVALTDALPAGLTLVGQGQSSGPALTLSSSGNTINDTLATLPSGGSAVILVQARASAALTAGTTLSDTASVSTTTLDPIQANNMATAPTTVGPVADMAVSLNAAGVVNTGSDITYTLTVTNNGPDTGQNVTVSDAFPAGTTFVSQTQSSGPTFTLGTSSGQLHDTIASLAPGQSAVIQATFLVTASAGTALSDTATVSSATFDSNNANNTATASSMAGPLNADLAVTTTGPASVTAGTDVTYTVTLTNNGPLTAQNVVLNDVLPASAAIVSQTQQSGPAFTLSASGNQVSDTSAAFSNGTSAVFQVVVLVPANTPSGTSWTEQASVTSTTPDPVSTNNTASVPSTVATSADLATANFAPAYVAANANYTYTITVFNQGPSDAQAVVLTDALPSPATLVSQTQLSGPTATLGTSGNGIRDTIATLPSGQYASFLVVAHVPSGTASGTALPDTANVSATTADPNLANNIGPVQSFVSNGADLAITAGVSPALVSAGATQTYTLTVTNNGPFAAQNVMLSDLLPANTTFVSQSQTSGTAFTLANSGNQVSDSLGSLASGQSAVFQVVARVNAGTTPGTIVSDSATVSATTIDPNLANNTATAQDTVGPLADLAVQLAGPSSAVAGTDRTYTVTVANNGPSTAQNVVLSDTLPAGTTLVSQSQTSGPSFTLGTNNGNPSDTIASLASGQSAVITMVVAVPSGTASGSTLTDSATAGSATTDPDTTNNSAQVQATVSTQTDVAVGITGPASPVAGTDVTYTVTIANNGPSDAQNVTLADTLPAGTTLVSQTQTSGPTFTLGTNNGNPSDTLSTLTAGQGATFAVVVAVPASTAVGTTLTDSAQAGTSTSETNLTNNTAQAQAPVSVSADVVVMVNGPSNPVAGTTVTYTLTVCNYGPSDAQNVTVTDTLPPGATLVAQTMTGGPTFTLGSSNGNPDDTIATLPVGISSTIEVTVSLPANLPPGTLTDVLQATSTTPDPDTNNNTAQTQAPLIASADVVVFDHGPSSVVAGTNATYTLTICNAGPSDAQNVTLTDSLPPGTTLVSQTQTGGPTFTLGTSNGNPNDTIATLPANLSATFEVVVFIPANTPAGTTLTNSDQGSSTTSDPDLTNNTAQTQAAVSASADLCVTIDGPSAPVAGTNITYTVTVCNSGPSDAQNVTLDDTLPAGTTFVSQAQTGGPTFTLGTSNGNPSDTIATLANGDTATFEIVVAMPPTTTAGTLLTDAAQVSATTPDPDTTNNSDQAQAAVIPSADLAVTLSGPSNPVAGLNATYTVRVSNHGPDDAQNVVLSDTLPSGTTLISQTQTSGPAFTLNAGSGNPNDTLATLAAGQSATLELVVSIPATAPASSTLTDSASVTSTTFDPDTTNNTAQAQATVDASADLAVRVFGPTSPTAGTNATYTITLDNNGPSDAQNVTLEDTLPAGTALVSQTQTSGPSFTLNTNNGNPSETRSTLANGQRATFEIVVSVPANMPAGTTLIDTAHTASTTPDPEPANNTARTQTTTTVSADVAVTVSGPASVLAGGNATYTVTAANNGPSDAQNVVLDDLLPAGTTLVAQTQTNGPAFTLGTNDGNPRDTAATLAGGATALFTVVVAVPSGTPVGTTLTDLAGISSSTTDPVLSNNQAQTQGTVSVGADLAVTLAGPSNPVAGTNAAYTVTVTNNGPSDAQGVLLTDSLPAGTTLVSQTQLSGPSFTLGTSNGAPSDSINTLAVGKSATFAVVVSIPANATSGNTLTDSATVSSATADPDSSNNTAQTQAPLAASADVVVFDHGPGSVLAGTNATYTLTICNAGPSDAQNVTLTDSLPSGTTLVSQTQTGGPTFTPGTGETIATLPANVSATFEVVVFIPANMPAGTTLTSSDQGSSTTSDPDLLNNTSQAQASVNASADLAVTLTGPANPVAGTTVTYTLTAVNNGPSDAHNITLADTLPAGTTLVSQTQTSGPAFALGTNNGNPSATLATLAAGQQATFQLLVAVSSSTPAGTMLTDSARIGSVTNDPSLANNTDQAQAAASAIADMAVTLTGPTNPVAGTNVTYTLTVANNGPSDAQNVTLADTLPSGTTLVSQTQTSGPGFTLGTNNGNPNDTAAGVASGQSATFVLVVAVPSSSSPGSSLTDAASVSSANSDSDPTNNTAQVQATLSASADVAVSIAGPANPVAGVNATYTLTVVNNGPSDAQGVELTDTLPSGTSLVSQTQTSGPSFTLATNGGNPDDTLATLTSGQNATFEIVISIPTNTPTGTNLLDSANVSSTTPDANLANNNAQTQATLGVGADLVVRVNGPSTPVAGTNVTYTLTVRNAGPSDAQNVTLTDALPSGTTLVSQTQTSGPSFTLGTNNGSPSDGITTLVNGASATFEVVVTVPADTAAGTTLTDGAQVASATGDPDLSNNTAQAQAPVNTSADVVVMVNGPSNPIAGTTVTYTLTVCNYGPSDAQNVTVTDTLPPGATLVAQTMTGGPTFTLGTSNGNPDDTIATLSAGISSTIEVVVSLPPDLLPGTLTDTLQAFSDTPDPNTSNNTAQAQAPLTASADVVAFKHGPSSVVAGTNATYTLTVCNAGPSDAQNVTLTDSLPPGTRLVSQTQTGGPTFTLGTSNGNPSDTVATLPANLSATFEVVVSIPANAPSGTTVTNSDHATSTTGDPDPANDTAQTQAAVTTSADLKVMVDGPTDPVAGSTVTYTLSICNNGPSDAQNVAVTDTLPSGATFVSQTQTSGPVFHLDTNNGSPDDTIATLASGGCSVIQLVVTLAPTIPPGTTLTDKVQVNGTTPDPDLTNNSAQARASTTAQAGLSIQQTVDQATPNVGDTVIFMVMVTNAGPSTATGVTVTDPLPLGLSFTGVTVAPGMSYDPASATWTIGTLAPGASATLELRAAVVGPAANTVTASVAHVDQLDPTLPARSSVTLTPQEAALTVTKTVDNPSPTIGDTVVFRVDLQNNGPNDATHVTVQDVLPPGLTLISATSDTGTYDAGSGSWTVGTVANGKTVELVVKASVNNPGQVTNWAALTHTDQFDPTPAGDSADVVVQVQPKPDNTPTNTDGSASPLTVGGGGGGGGVFGGSLPTTLPSETPPDWGGIATGGGGGGGSVSAGPLGGGGGGYSGPQKLPGDLGIGAGAGAAPFGQTDTPARISGVVYHDVTGTGLLTPGNVQGLPNARVVLTGSDDQGHSVLRTTTSDEHGYYEFNNLPPGNYTVALGQSEGVLPGREVVGTVNGERVGKAVDAGAISQIALPPGGEGVAYHLGQVLPASVSGSVFQQESGQLGLAGVQVTLTGTDDHGQLVHRETTTDAGGFYAFRNLRPGKYAVQVGDMDGYQENHAEVGTVGGNVAQPSQVIDIALPSGVEGARYNFTKVSRGLPTRRPPDRTEGFGPGPAWWGTETPRQANTPGDEESWLLPLQEQPGDAQPAPLKAAMAFVGAVAFVGGTVSRRERRERRLGRPSVAPPRR